MEYIENIIETHNLVDHRTDRNIFSIDPTHGKDFDDAFSIEKLENKTTRISIYISNVSFWMDILDLWSSFNERITTIYLPDRKRPMLPTVLSDALCSLTENDIRFAFLLELYIDENNQLTHHEFYNSVIKVKRNLRYDTEEQENHHDYKILLEIVKKMNRKSMKYVDSIDTSHDVVAYLMVTMNYICAKKLEKLKCGVFRSAKLRTKKNYQDIFPQMLRNLLEIGIVLEANTISLKIWKVMKYWILMLMCILQVLLEGWLICLILWFYKKNLILKK